MPQVSISVVVPAYNAAGDIEHFFAALLPQLGPDDECIVVDDGSRDRTKDLVRAAPVRLIEMEKNSGPAAARNRGAAIASGDILFFLDSDVVAMRGILDKVRAHFADPANPPAVMGSYDDQPMGQSTVSKFRNLLHCYVHRTGNPEASTFWTGCGAIKRELFHKMGGFDSARFAAVAIEDVHLGIRMRQAGYRILLDPSLEVQHRKVWTWKSMIRTDIFSRAVPWSMLILEGNEMMADLNLKPQQRLCAIAVVLALALVPVLYWSPLWAGLAILALLGFVVAANWDFYRFLARCGGWGFAVRCLPAHWVYYLCGTAGMGIAVLKHLWSRIAARSNRSVPASEA